ncbi:hypothetical protein L5515_007203 [Caenorhabditis briggsae]|uniref:Uncharacterized protein n=1 Tax=Caenorhabditis briggsae TaxID=6238 RepID=A0AAE9JJ49_CAEBR|nr:hypothetical protein L5515_007203 [Caenorhabditis briggsae]
MIGVWNSIYFRRFENDRASGDEMTTEEPMTTEHKNFLEPKVEHENVQIERSSSLGLPCKFVFDSVPHQRPVFRSTNLLAYNPP